MDDKVNEILERLPAKPPRSRLDPHATLIEEMRRRGRTFAEISRVLAEECQVSTSPSNIHHFMKLRARMAKIAKRTGAKFAVSSEVVCPPSAAGATVPKPTPPTDAALRIAALKQRKLSPPPTSEEFDYDPNEPLRLVNPGKSGMGS
jgi:FAD/FMN-containing dehydrogenase